MAAIPDSARAALARDGLYVEPLEDGQVKVTCAGALAHRGIDDVRAKIDMIAPAIDASPAERLALLKKLLSELPPTHLLRRRPVRADFMADDAALVSLFLDPPRPVWRLPALLTRLRAEGLSPIEIVDGARMTPPEIDTPPLGPRLETLTPEQAARFAELFHGGDDMISIIAERVESELPLWEEPATTADDRDELVQTQYELYPYPARDPKDEPEKVKLGSPSNLAEINHYVFGGKRDFSQPFRALVAGGGTGDATIMLAQQMVDWGVPGEVVYMDLSASSRAVAEARAKARGLTNVSFVSGSLMDLDESEHGRFDYIDCCGVLHHLEAPAEGLGRLAGVLAPGGGIGMMLYGELGRVGVYDMQEMLRMVAAPGAVDEARRVAIAKALIEVLPETNWLVRNGQIRDHVVGGDAGVYDLFLHSRDRAYRVPEILALAQSAHMTVTGFIEPVMYDPLAWLRDAGLRRAVSNLRPFERAAFAELLLGCQKKHIFYMVPADSTVTLPRFGMDMVPVLRDLDGPAEAKRLRPGAALSATTNGLKITMRMPAMGPAIMRRIDGTRAFRDIHADIAETQQGLSVADFERQAGALYDAFHGINRMLLAEKVTASDE